MYIAQAIASALWKTNLNVQEMRKSRDPWPSHCQVGLYNSTKEVL